MTPHHSQRSRASYSPTSLRMLDEHCPRALDFLQDGAPIDREGFHVGTAAHRCVEAITIRAREEGRLLEPDEIEDAAGGACMALLTDGSGYDEPPMRPSAALEGRDLAIRWARVHPIPPDTKPELRGSFDREWQPAPWDSPDARFRLILDQAVELLEYDEELGDLHVMEITELKTSWAANADLLDSLQLKAQAVATWLAIDDGGMPYDLIRLRIGNMRTTAIYSRDLAIWSDAEDGDLIIKWRDDLTLAMDAADAQIVGLIDDDGFSDGKGRAPRPGTACLGCDYVMRCKDAATFLSMVMPTPESLASAYCIAQARRDKLFGMVKKAVADETIHVDGKLVGYIGKESKRPAEDAVRTAVAAWQAFAGCEGDEMTGGAVRGLLDVLQPSVSGLARVAKTVHAEKEARPEREALAASMSETFIRPTFGVHDEEGS